jgi:GntR family transcriptional regulator
VYVERLQLADQVPLALDRSWIPSRLADGLADLDLSDRGLYNELAERFGLSPDAASERIHALLPGRKERDLLRLPANTAAFQIDRWAVMNGRPIVFSHTLVRGDLYSLLIEWRGQSMTDVELTNGLAPFVP